MSDEKTQRRSSLSIVRDRLKLITTTNTRKSTDQQQQQFDKSNTEEIAAAAPLFDPLTGVRYPDTWSPMMRVVIASVRQTMELGKDNVALARTVVQKIASPTPPVATKITKVYIPRRKDILPDGMDPADGEGNVKAEWVDWRISITSGDGAPKFENETDSPTVMTPGELSNGVLPTPPAMSRSKSGRSGSILGRKITRGRTFSFGRDSSFGSVGSSGSASSENFLSWKSDKVILYIHGGAFFLGSRKTHRTVTWRFARGSRCRVLSIDYRLSPEAVFPLGLQDCISAYLYLLDPPAAATHPRYPPENIVFMGDSAGGNLAIVLALWIRENGAKYNIPMPAGVCGISPWVDLTHSQPSFVLHGDIDYLPYASRDSKYIHKDRAHYYTNHNDQLSNPLVSPLHAKVDDRDAKLPATTFRFANALLAGKAAVTEAETSPGGESRFAEAGAPKYGTAKDESKTELIPLPPIYVQTGTVERLHHENIAFAVDTLKNSPAPVILELYEDMPHVIPFFFFESIATLATRNACRFVRDAVGVPAIRERVPPKVPAFVAEADVLGMKRASPTDGADGMPTYVRRFAKYLNRSGCPEVPLDCENPMDIVVAAKAHLEEIKHAKELQVIGGVNIGSGSVQVKPLKRGLLTSKGPSAAPEKRAANGEAKKEANGEVKETNEDPKKEANGEVKKDTNGEPKPETVEVSASASAEDQALEKAALEALKPLTNTVDRVKKAENGVADSDNEE